ncbi:MAG: hypothetical protein NPIRA04_13060 [Nitrospirales bacterium]|nr:MAG: hypothetical protein NPIRA04_13060 [Nitrospirales bacterium]
MCTILLFGSDLNLYELLDWLPDSFGLEVLRAWSLPEGMRILNNQIIDLVVVNYSIHQNGLSMISEVTAYDHHPPIIATCSARDTPHIDVIKFPQIIGASYTFEKPVNKRLFRDAFLELIYFPTNY